MQSMLGIASYRTLAELWRVIPGPVTQLWLFIAATKTARRVLPAALSEASFEVYTERTIRTL